MSNEAVIDWLAKRGVLCSAPPAIVSTLTFEPTIRFFGSGTLLSCRLGAYTYAGGNLQANLTSIGRYCSLGHRVTISPSRHPTTWVTTSPIAYKDIFGGSTGGRTDEPFDELLPVSIGNDVWIGADATVMGGISIGDGAIVAYGSVVTKNVPAYAIVGGTPAKIIRMRFPSATIAAIDKFKWWNYDLVNFPGKSINWSNPLQALDDMRRKFEDGTLRLIPGTLHQLYKQGKTGYGMNVLK